jgi:hypothetical protein
LAGHVPSPQRHFKNKHPGRETGRRRRDFVSLHSRVGREVFTSNASRPGVVRESNPRDASERGATHSNPRLIPWRTIRRPRKDVV